MLNFDEARRRILAAGDALEPELVALTEAEGRVLAEDLYANAPLPAFDYSAMDGYAVRAADVNQRLQQGMPIAGECRAGDTPPALPAGAALRIFTGAPLPVAADAVVIQENATRRGDVVVFSEAATVGDNIRRAGEDLTQGGLALAKGTRLGPFQLGLAAAVDRASVLVARRPRVRIFATGSELRAPGSPLVAGKIPESNTIAVAALSRHAGALVERCEVQSDDLAGITFALSTAFEACDVLVTIGGVSVGDHDLVRPALEAAGATLEFWKVAIKPGKPLSFGRAGRTLILGLPGNPVSAQLTFALFGVPLLRALQGDLAASPALTRVTLDSKLQQKCGRLGFYRARLQGTRAIVTPNQASGSTFSLAHADALVMMPAELSECAAETQLDAICLRDL